MHAQREDQREQAKGQQTRNRVVKTGEASLDLWCDHPADGRFLGSVAVPCTGGRYAWTEVSAGLAPAAGVRDLYVVLRGRQRLASVCLRGVTGGPWGVGPEPAAQ